MEKMKCLKSRIQKFGLITVLFFSVNVFGYSQLSAIFKDATKEAGINHSFKVYEGMFGGGACVFDFNNDGFEDLYITGGMNNDQLYKNNKNGTFTNVFEGSGLEITKNYVTQGVVSADVNKDGYRDLYITTITYKDKKLVIPRAENLLFLNKGNGTFRDVTKEYGLDQMKSFATGASFGDIDADGYPDLYVGNYFNQFEGKLSSISDATVVGANQIAKGYLLKNNKGKSFTDIYEDYGLNHKGFGFGGVFSDYDNDKDLDLIVNHDFGYKRTPNLFLNNQFPKSRFKDMAEILKMDLKINSMGTAVGDYNNDGFMDYYFTNIRFNYFLESQGQGKAFRNSTLALGLNMTSISWGANFADFDHDGDLDLYVANGDLNPNCVPMGNFYFENVNNVFKENGRAMGVNDYGIGRGSVIFDIENDGDMDILVVNQIPVSDYPVESYTRLFKNEAARGNWLKVALKGIEHDKNGLGSRIEILVNGKKMIREVDGGASSHLSQNSSIVHFGIANASSIESVKVIWPGGKEQIVQNPKVNALLTIVETSATESNFLWYLLASSIGLIAFVLIFRRLRR